MSAKDEYVAQMKAKLDEWNARIDELEAKGRQQQAQSSQEYHQRMARLKTRRDEASQKLGELQDAGEDAWENLKAGADVLWEDLQKTFEDTRKTLAGG